MTQITSTDVATVPAAAAVGRVVVSAAAPSLPGASVAAAQARAKVDPAALSQAVKQLNELYATRQTNLHFFVDESTHETVVTVVDQSSGDVLRQFPSEEALRIARALSSTPGNLIKSVA